MKTKKASQTIEKPSNIYHLSRFTNCKLLSNQLYQNEYKDAKLPEL
ncbi:MAG: hypothetical protein ACJAUH_001097 [Saprospiraceae bacterium]|jgi:hypothetical protein